ncbi:Rpn family recombination-promoting nuclease/putative transposase [Castellaniella sp.]|uniref:Rpn family recombination-promoting nuclease/putative transposase n=1 Tax=Castellaniella sp. TaxID=1955812 RepID=UPI003A912E5B
MAKRIKILELACVLSPRLFVVLDWDHMFPVPTNHVSDRLHQRTGDCAWLIPQKKRPSFSTAGGEKVCSPEQVPPQGLCILLLLEPQSQSDTTMALRLISYAGLSYQTLLNSKLIGLPLPPVLPVVLYSGRRRWRAPLDISGLLGDVPEDLRHYQPRMRYLLVHERELLKAAGLPDRNLAVLLFRMGSSQDIECWRGLLHTLIQVVREQPEHEELNRSLTIWLLHMAQRSAPPEEALPPVNTLQELDMMTAEKPGLWARQWLREGRREGRAEGLADLLLNMIQRRFGPVPDDVTQRIRAAQASQLETWSLNLLDAAVLDDVFRPGQ